MRCYQAFFEINCSTMVPFGSRDRRGLTRSETYPKKSKKDLLSVKKGLFKNKIKCTQIILICVATEHFFEINCSSMIPSEGTSRRGLTRPETYPKIIEIGSRSSENGLFKVIPLKRKNFITEMSTFGSQPREEIHIYAIHPDYNSLWQNLQFSRCFLNWRVWTLSQERKRGEIPKQR